MIELVEFTLSVAAVVAFCAAAVFYICSRLWAQNAPELLRTDEVILR
jgi:uncharacterized membrane protein